MGPESQCQSRHGAICQIEAFASEPVHRSSDSKVCEALHRGVTFENGVSVGASVWVRKEANQHERVRTRNMPIILFL